ncbi:MAG: hypothetical protein ACFCBW_03360 [Candidatus Competibacterales bacterium]
MSQASAMEAQSASLRHLPALKELFRAAENRQFTVAELDEYLQAAPHAKGRAAAAREIGAVEEEVVEAVVREIFALYPYEQRHNYSTAKCIRDVRSVSAYATLAMLMDDPDWFRDKLLLWLRTILQAFEFPDRLEKRRRALFSNTPNQGKLDHLTPGQRSIFETYTKLKLHYRERLSSEAFALFEPFLQQAVDTLSH